MYVIKNNLKNSIIYTINKYLNIKIFLNKKCEIIQVKKYIPSNNKISISLKDFKKTDKLGKTKYY